MKLVFATIAATLVGGAAAAEVPQQLGEVVPFDQQTLGEVVPFDMQSLGEVVPF